MEIPQKTFFSLDFSVQRIGVTGVPTPFSLLLKEEIVPNTNDIVESVLGLT